MSTRSQIAMLSGNDAIKTVYCHWDGYPDHNGRILTEAYTTPERVAELLGHGDISQLGRKIGRKHDFNKRVDDTCTFYKRDRNETGVDAQTVPASKFEEYLVDSWVEWVYLFKAGEWFVSKWTSLHRLEFRRVADVLAELEKQEA